MEPNHVKFIRETFNLSKRNLAKALNIGTYTITRWENGETTPSGLQLEVLQGLYNTAIEVGKKKDEQQKSTIAGLLTLGIGGLIFHLLTKIR